MFQQGIRATGYVRAADDNRRLDAGPGAYPMHRWRQRLGERLGHALPNPTGEALMRALVLGDHSRLEPEHWEVLTRTGTNHLVAISGLHVGLVATFLFFLVRWAWSRSARLVLMIAAPRAAALGLLPLLLLLFDRASLIAPLVNLIAIPLFTLLLPVILITSLLSLVPGPDLPLVLTAQVLEAGFGLLETISRWSWAMVTLSAHPGWVWARAFLYHWMPTKK